MEPDERIAEQSVTTGANQRQAWDELPSIDLHKNVAVTRYGLRLNSRTPMRIGGTLPAVSPSPVVVRYRLPVGGMGAKPNGGSDRGSDVIGDMRSVADALVAALDAADNGAAEVIRTARLERVSGPEELLVLRSALISTRSEWGRAVDDDLSAAAASALAAAKKHAIELR